MVVVFLLDGLVEERGEGDTRVGKECRFGSRIYGKRGTSSPTMAFRGHVLCYLVYISLK